ncbi:multidrug efflux system membrane fusion protein [Bradyrhizobium sp. AZCC 1588]|uniref:efflux RND transporter periplasmic adaptor subunit n=1 Tax=unclassified Bradyrhizobium TaxID=2631580 RepID=UPI002FF257D0
MTTRNLRLGRLISVGFALVLVACNGQSPADSHGEAARDGAKATVSVTVVEPSTVTLVDELPARVSAFRTAEIRAQVGGIVEKRLFEQGMEVTAGQPLFQISPLPFKADVDSAVAALEHAEAALIREQNQFERKKKLVESLAVSRESYDDTVAQLAQAKANVAGAQATLQRRRIELDFATIRAPISGKVGPALVSEGALVAASDAKTMASIQQIDQVYVDVRRPASQIDRVAPAARSGGVEDASKLPVAILTAGGKPYPVSGRALFSDISVDPTTGNVAVRVLVDNSSRILLPGMYVRARVPRAIRHGVLLVPQQAVVRNADGQPQVVVVNAERQGEVRKVAVGEIVDRQYIVTDGLKSGDIVVVEGQDRVRGGATLEIRTASRSAASMQD